MGQLLQIVQIIVLSLTIPMMDLIIFRIFYWFKTEFDQTMNFHIFYIFAIIQVYYFVLFFIQNFFSDKISLADSSFVGYFVYMFKFFQIYRFPDFFVIVQIFVIAHSLLYYDSF